MLEFERKQRNYYLTATRGIAVVNIGGGGELFIRLLVYAVEQGEVTSLYRTLSPMQKRAKGGENVMLSV